jgi:hypothetical protein
MVPVISRTTASIPLYGHTEGVTVGSDYKLLKTAVPDGTAANMTLESAADGYVALGNSSVIALSSIDSQIYSLPTATWTVTYRAVANVTEKASLLCNLTIVESDGTLRKSLGGFVAETATNLTDAFATYTGSYSHTGYVVNTTDYLRVQWYAHKYDTTKLQVDLLLDSAAVGTTNSTKVTLTKEYDALTGSQRTFAYLALTFMFVAMALTAIYVGIKAMKKR